MTKKQFFIDVVTMLDTTDLTKDQWLDVAVCFIDVHANNGDSDLGKLRAALAPAGRDTADYREGVREYIGAMARHGDHGKAMDVALPAAGLEPLPAVQSPSIFTDMFTLRSPDDVEGATPRMGRSLFTRRRHG